MGKVLVASAVLLTSAVLTVSVGLEGSVSEEAGSMGVSGMPASGQTVRVRASEGFARQAASMLSDSFYPDEEGTWATWIVPDVPPVQQETAHSSVQFYY